MKKNLLKLAPIISILAFAPVIAYAQAAGLTDLVTKISDLLKSTLPLLVSAGVIYFIWGVIVYFIADSEEAKKTGRDRIIFGIIGLAIILSIWGIVAILNQTLGLGGASGLNGVNAPNITNLVPAAGSACPDLSKDAKLSTFLDYFTCVIGHSVIPFLFAVATLMFIWGTINFFIINADEEAKRAQGRQFMIWGVVALAVMISVWGLVNILGQTFHIDTQFLPQVKP